MKESTRQISTSFCWCIERSLLRHHWRAQMQLLISSIVFPWNAVSSFSGRLTLNWFFVIMKSYCKVSFKWRNSNNINNNNNNVNKCVGVVTFRWSQSFWTYNTFGIYCDRFDFYDQCKLIFELHKAIFFQLIRLVKCSSSCFHS